MDRRRNATGRARGLARHSVVLAAGLLVGLQQTGHAHELELLSIGARGGLNSKILGIPPTEKEDFFQSDAFAVIGLGNGWESPGGWQMRWQITAAAGVIGAAGDTGFIGELVPGVAFTKPNTKFTFDLGAGAAYLSDYRFGDQDIGGPVQIIAQGGITCNLPGDVSIGWRFHHMSDAHIYGDNRGVDMQLIELSYRF